LRYSNNQLLASLALGIILLFGIFSTAITSPSSSYLYAQQQQQQLQQQQTQIKYYSCSKGCGQEIYFDANHSKSQSGKWIPLSKETGQPHQCIAAEK
jgi:hypothetical protein